MFVLLLAPRALPSIQNSVLPEAWWRICCTLRIYSINSTFFQLYVLCSEGARSCVKCRIAYGVLDHVLVRLDVDKTLLYALAQSVESPTAFLSFLFYFAVCRLRIYSINSPFFFNIMFYVRKVLLGVLDRLLTLLMC